MKLLCCVVLYKCNLVDAVSFNRCAKSAVGRVDTRLFVFDNSPVPYCNTEELNEMGVVYLSDTSNPGVSHAYNAAAGYARDNGYDWLLLLDQDTDFKDENYLDYCIKTISDNSNSEAIAPCVYVNNELFSPQKGLVWPKKGNYIIGGYNSIKNASIINSGLLVKVDTFFSVGGYNENVPLDLADHQFMYRLGKNGVKFYLMNFELFQSFSNNVDNFESLKFRFNSLTIGCLNFEADFLMRLKVYVLMSKRCFSLTSRYNTFAFIKILLKNICKRIRK